MAETIRTFIAIDVPSGIKEQVGAIAADLRPRYRIGWARPEGMHLTLSFLGDLTQEQVQTATEATQQAVADIDPFSAGIAGWGCFPNPGRPRVIWAGIGDGREQIILLADGIRKALADAGLSDDGKRFHPHLTVARVKDPGAGKRAFGEVQQSSLPENSFSVDRVIVFRSVLDRRGAIYTPQAVCYFG